jgi:retron-type reverse transcriptase
MIPTRHGKDGQYEVTVPTWADKLVGEAARLLLDAYYDPQFSAHSHGFRKGRGCHTALSGVQRAWTGTTWFIEGDISDCFGSLDHQVMVSIHLCPAA